MVGEHAFDDVLLSRGQVDLRGGQLRMPEHVLHVSERHRRPEALMSPARPDVAPAVKPIEVSTELKALMRRPKLGQLLDTLPERLALARTNRLSHHDFLEMLFADEVTRRDRESATRRAKAVHLDPAMHLQAWDESTAVAFLLMPTTCSSWDRSESEKHSWPTH